MTDTQTVSENQEYDPIRIAPLPQQRAYTIHESELNELERGTPIQIYFSLSIFFFSISGSLFGSLITDVLEKWNNLDKFIVYVLIEDGILFLIGITLLLVWWCKRKNVKQLAQQIRSRLDSN